MSENEPRVRSSMKIINPQETMVEIKAVLSLRAIKVIEASIKNQALRDQLLNNMELTRFVNDLSTLSNQWEIQESEGEENEQ